MKAGRDENSGKTLISKFPDMFNKYTRKVYKRAGPFDYRQHKISKTRDPVEGPYRLSNEAVYLGQWKNGLKNGRGKLGWEDGALFEGQF